MDSGAVAVADLHGAGAVVTAVLAGSSKIAVAELCLVRRVVRSGLPGSRRHSVAGLHLAVHIVLAVLAGAVTRSIADLSPGVHAGGGAASECRSGDQGQRGAGNQQKLFHGFVLSRLRMERSVQEPAGTTPFSAMWDRSAAGLPAPTLHLVHTGKVAVTDLTDASV